MEHNPFANPDTFDAFQKAFLTSLICADRTVRKELSEDFKNGAFGKKKLKNARYNVCMIGAFTTRLRTELYKFREVDSDLKKAIALTKSRKYYRTLGSVSEDPLTLLVDSLSNYHSWEQACVLSYNFRFQAPQHWDVFAIMKSLKQISNSALTEFENMDEQRVGASLDDMNADISEAGRIVAAAEKINVQASVIVNELTKIAEELAA